MHKVFGEELGLNIENNKIVIPSDRVKYAASILEQASKEINKLEQEKLEEDNLKEEDFSVYLEDESVLSSEEGIIPVNDNEMSSSVDVYEKFLKDQNGEDLLVQISVIKQYGMESPYQRLVNINYISKTEGKITDKKVFGYENGHQFDLDVFPLIIQGFTKNVVKSKNIDLNAIDATKGYFTAEEDNKQLYLDGYSVDVAQSFLEYTRQNHYLGNENDYLNTNSLLQDENMEVNSNSSVEEEVVEDTKEKEFGPILSKRLGEMPNASNMQGFSNWLHLLLFISIDIIAIIVGIYFLLG